LAGGFERFAWHGSANIAIPEIPPHSWGSDGQTPWFRFCGARPINGSMPVYDRQMIDIVIDRWDEFAKKLKDGKVPVFTI
jgi:hypothetical protein